MDPRVTERARVDSPDPQTSLALWLRAGRAQRKLSLEDIARITKIQPRILEKLESGQLDGLPAEVFVRGFVRSFAKCVGLDETEALVRLGACGGPLASASSPVARALVDTMSDLAPVTAKKIAAPAPVVEPIPASEPADSESADSELESIDIVVELAPVETVAVAAEPEAKKKRTRKKPGTTTPRPRSKKAKAQTEIAAAAAPVVEAKIVVVEIADSAPVVVEDAALALADGSSRISTPIAIPMLPMLCEDSTQVWQPTMPPIASTPSVPWRRPTFTAPVSYAAPVLTIDDSDPELAELERDEREAGKGPHRVSFLPPILLDREDKSARQGGLTLAVIILLIAATLTLSYLMRRPSVSGDGVTMAETPSMLLS